MEGSLDWNVKYEVTCQWGDTCCLSAGIWTWTGRETWAGTQSYLYRPPPPVPGPKTRGGFRLKTNLVWVYFLLPWLTSRRSDSVWREYFGSLTSQETRRWLVALVAKWKITQKALSKRGWIKVLGRFWWREPLHKSWEVNLREQRNKGSFM